MLYQTLSFTIHGNYTENYTTIHGNFTKHAMHGKWYKNNKFERSAPTWNEHFELLDESYSLSNIQDRFEYIINKHDTVTDNPSIMINLN